MLRKPLASAEDLPAHVFDEGSSGLVTQAVPHEPAFAPPRDDAARMQQAKMTRCVLLSHVELVGKCLYGRLAMALKVVNDANPERLAQQL